MSITETETSPQTWAAAFDDASDRLFGRGLPWLAERRAAARARFLALGFPSRRWEDWRYFDANPLARATFAPARGVAPARGEVEAALARLPGGGSFHRLVFVNGLLVTPLTILHELPPGVRVLSFIQATTEIPALLEKHLGRHAFYEDHPFAAANLAWCRDGIVIHVPRGVHVERPIEAIFLTTKSADDSAAHLRHLVVAEEDSAVSVVEVYHGSHGASYFNNVVTEIVAAPRAHVVHVRIQEDSPSAFHLSNTRVQQGADSSVESHVITTGARVSRNELGFALSAPGASCVLNGLFVLNGNQEADNHTLVDHEAPNCSSKETYKGVADGRSLGSFTGRVVVRPGAQLTDAQQSSRNLLLSRDAQINTRPQLEIYADDVKCSHGATTGQLDDNALFYIRTRGLDEIRARQILTRAFAADIIQRIPIPGVREHLLLVVEDRLCPGHVLEESV